MNIKTSLGLLSALAAIAAGSQAFAASKVCAFQLPVSSQQQCRDPNVANSFVLATVASGGSSDSWTYRLNYVAGPLATSGQAKLFNADGLTATVDKISHKACVVATDSSIDGNFGSPQVCVTAHAGTTGAPTTIRVTIP
jgi:hypothetical protein